MLEQDSIMMSTDLTQAVPLHTHAAALHATVRVGGLPVRLLLDTGSAFSWVVANGGLKLAGRGLGACRPTGSNFSVSYADKSSASGVKCETEMQLGDARASVVIGAALSVSEGRTEGRSGALPLHGVLALSPAAESSLAPLLRAMPPAGRRLGICSARHLVVGGRCTRNAHSALPLPLHSLAAPPAQPRHWKFRASAVMLALAEGAPGARSRRSRRPRTRVTRLHASGERVAMQLDTGCTHSRVASPPTHAKSRNSDAPAPPFAKLTRAACAQSPRPRCCVIISSRPRAHLRQWHGGCTVGPHATARAALGRGGVCRRAHCS